MKLSFQVHVLKVVHEHYSDLFAFVRSGDSAFQQGMLRRTGHERVSAGDSSNLIFRNTSP